MSGEDRAQFLAMEALAKLATHEAVCTERYENLAQSHADGKTARDELKTSIAAVRASVGKIYDRMWAIAIVLLGAETAIIVGVVAWVMQRSIGAP
jgi:hypothetical protein